jgi:uncharacterized SAM-binding protein YcdF (DUF218 family)
MLASVTKRIAYPLIFAFLTISIAVSFGSKYCAAYLIYIKKPSQVDSIYVFCGDLNEYLWRIEAAADAFKQFNAKEILLSDDRNIGPWVPELQKNLTFVERGKRKLMESGIPEEKILLLPGNLGGTIGEARILQKHFLTHPTNSLLIVTSPYHLRRAHWSVRKSLGSTSSIYTCTFALRSHPETLSLTYLATEYFKLFLYWVTYSSIR